MIRSTLFLALITLSFSNAQLTFNALEKMKQPFSFAQQSIIARLMATQAKQIEEGVMTEFESRCISSNIVIMMGDTNAERFTAIAEKAYAHQMESLSVDEISFMQTVNDKYMTVLAIVAEECSQKPQKETHE
ncbi:hypothetical protein [Wohlfahrtiimonas larvae]|uniref:Uncharacterized protein n=1 Tax=Wohlfahrtiimonas larvae TaxID=1157986 RepID=A0ABP9MJZ5_9GAMM|nr:hypothetical protein [Wohlfahrtiimonas larvae]